MTDVLFDTLAVSRQLKARGFEVDQAEAITDAVRAGVTGGVAVKADIAELRTELKADITELRTELKTDITELRTELKTDIAELRTELKTDIAELRTELRWIKAIGGVIVALLVWMIVDVQIG